MSAPAHQRIWKNLSCSVLVRHFSWSSVLASNTGHSQSQSISLVGRDFLNPKHFRADDIKQFLWTAKDLKTRIKDNGEIFQPLKGKTAALIFQKRSVKTRLSAELGIARLGGIAAFLGPDDVHLDVGQSVHDTGRMLGGMADLILAGVNDQQSLDTLADAASIPVINGSSHSLHPLQTLAIYMTLQEYFGYLRGCKIAWIGRGNNILNALMYGCARLGVDLSVATPPGFEPDVDITFDAMRIAGKTGASFQMGNNPLEAVYRADAIIADAWVNSEQTEEGRKKLVTDFQGYQVNRKMLKEAGGSWVFLHSLPRQPEEVTDDIFYGEESLVWQQAENSMWTAMSVMLHVLKPHTPSIPTPKYVRG